jgi:hypothetical protein
MKVNGPLDKLHVSDFLEKLKRRDTKYQVFGSGEHRYELAAPLPLSFIEAVEQRHGIRFPEEYKYFITAIGNGGAGPYYGLFSFDRDDDGHTWESGHLVGDLSKPFPHTTAWNLPDSFWQKEPNPPVGTPVEEEDRLYEAWDKVLVENYWNPTLMNGAIPVCHMGCALRQWLIVNGEQKGFLWNDYRADNGGVLPLLDNSGRQVTFAGWYLSWLNEALQQCSWTGAFRRWAHSLRAKG